MIPLASQELWPNVERDLITLEGEPNKSTIKERDLVTAGGRPAARSSLKKMQLDVLSHQRYRNRDYMTALSLSLNFIFCEGKRTQKWVQFWDATTKSLPSISNKVSSLWQERKIAFFLEKIKRNVFLSARSGLTTISENVRQPTDRLRQLDTVFWGARGIAWPPVQPVATTVNSPQKQLGTLPVGSGHPALVLWCQLPLPGRFKGIVRVFEVGSYKVHIYSRSVSYRNHRSAQPQFGEVESCSSPDAQLCTALQWTGFSKKAKLTLL